MPLITLIATKHKESGRCNSTELLKILHSIKPDIVFEELSKPSFNNYYNGVWPDTLETFTIKRYKESTDVNHIPVDFDGNQLINKELKDSIQHMHNAFQGNKNYQLIELHLHKFAYEFGFPYLNSVQCEYLLAQKYFLEIELAQVCAGGVFLDVHQKWMRILDFRERHMLDNIYKYAEDNDFETGVYFVGAEHRKPIIDLIQQKKSDNANVIQWRFDYFSSENY